MLVVFAAFDLIDNSWPDAEEMTLAVKVPVNTGEASGAYTDKLGVPDRLLYGNVPVIDRLP